MKIFHALLSLNDNLVEENNSYWW